MAFFSWVGAERRLSNAALTVLVQAVSPNDQDVLLWDAFFPRRDVPSVKIDTITPVVATRWTADRREWNARGRYIPQEFPGTAQLEMVPIESYFKISEREIQDMEERNLGANAEQFRRQIGVDIPPRTEQLALANYRRIEVDTFSAWSTGNISVRNPVTGALYTASFGFDTARYQVASPAWTGGTGGTAYDKFMTWLRSAIEAGIPVGGAMMRLSTREAIRTSAPNTAFPTAAPGTFSPILADVESRIQQELGVDFRFYLNERHVDVFPDGGITTSQAKLWPAHTIAIVPAGDVVGYNAFAPVARAFEISRANPEAKIDVRGMTAYTETANNGRELTVECQVNALPVPLETNVWVIDAGI